MHQPRKFLRGRSTRGKFRSQESEFLEESCTDTAILVQVEVHECYLTPYSLNNSTTHISLISQRTAPTSSNERRFSISGVEGILREVEEQIEYLPRPRGSQHDVARILCKCRWSGELNQNSFCNATVWMLCSPPESPYIYVRSKKILLNLSSLFRLLQTLP